MVTRVPIYLGGTGESTQAAAQAALGLHTSNSVAFTTVTIGAVNVLANDYATLISATTNPIITGNVIINSNSANDALRITQIGSGNAFVVEDSANPDATPFVVDASGRVLAGITNGTSLALGGTIQSSVGGAAISGLTTNAGSSSARTHWRLAVIGNEIGGIGTNGTSMTFLTSNTEYMRIDSSGRVGIGTSSPDYPLSVQSGGDAQISLKNSSGNTEAYIATAGAFGSAGVDDLRIRSDAANIVFGFSGTETVRFTSSGSVGIGTSSPNVLLHLSGSSTTALARIASTSSGASAFDGSGAGLELLATGMNTTSKYAPAIKFGSTDPDFTTTNPKFGAAIVATAVQTYSLDTTGGMNLEFWTAPGNPGTGSGLVQNMTLTSAGRLGIGTTSPAATLDVVGTFSDAKANTVQQTLTDAATIAWDASLGRVATVTLGASRTFGAPTNLKVGTYILHVIQGGTGSYTITWDGVFKWTAATAPTLSTAVGRRDIFSFISDGTNLYGAMIPDVR